MDTTDAFPGEVKRAVKETGAAYPELAAVTAERDRYREALEAICRKHDEMVWGEDYEHVAVSNFADETARKALGFDGLPK